MGWIKGQPKFFINGHYARIQPHPDLAIRFWENVDCTTTPDGCWPWTGMRDRKGYGLIKVNGRTVKAGRIALELAGWIIPVKFLQVRHYICNNPPCCRASHLKIGTPKENSEDRDSQARQALGECNGQAKLDSDKVLAVLALYRRGVSGRGQEALAKQFGVSPKSIWNIIHGETWEHVSSLVETAEILADQNTLADLRASLEDIKHGRLIDHAEVGRRLGL
jgi:hypothetical protein